jgi:hypothetical protein
MDDWQRKSRLEKLASVMYPNLATEGTRKQMAELARGEGKRAPGASKLLSSRERGAVSPLGGQARR